MNVKFINKNTGISLDEAKQIKITELNAKCDEAIIGKFPFVINGNTYFFSNSLEAQSNFDKAERAFEKGWITEVKWTAYDANGNVYRLTLTKDVFDQLYQQHLQHIQNNISKFRDVLMPQVENATTVEGVNSITWDNA